MYASSDTRNDSTLASWRLALKERIMRSHGLPLEFASESTVWEMRTDRLVRLIQAGAPKQIIVTECRLVIRAFGWDKFWAMVLRDKIESLRARIVSH